MVRRIGWMLLTALVWIGTAGGSAQAGGIVTNCTETELRAAVSDGGLVILGCDATIKLTSTMAITSETVLDGGGRRAVISSGSANLSRLVHVLPGVSLTLRHVTFDGAAFTPVTPTNAVSGRSGDWAEGVALYVDRGQATLEDCTFSGHQVTGGTGTRATIAGTDGGNGGAGRGAALFNSGGLVRIVNSVFSYNQASGGQGGIGAAALISGNGGAGGEGGAAQGAAIFNTGQGSLRVESSTFLSNIVTGGLGAAGATGTKLGTAGTLGEPGPALGAALFIDSGSVTVSDSTFAANSGTGAAGMRGLFTTNSAFTQDGAPGGPTFGAGVFNRGGTVVLTRCHFVGNTLFGGAGGAGGAGSATGLGGKGGDGGDGGAAMGAGFYNGAEGSLTVIDTTFMDNAVTGGAGGKGGVGRGIASDGAIGQAGAQTHPDLFNSGGGLQWLNTLSADALSNQVRLSWPGAVASSLQITTDLSRTNGWSSVATPPTFTNGVQTLWITPTNRAAFYRLHDS
jgi:hypothetical protein